MYVSSSQPINSKGCTATVRMLPISISAKLGLVVMLPFLFVLTNPDALRSQSLVQHMGDSSLDAVLANSGIGGCQ